MTDHGKFNHRLVRRITTEELAHIEYLETQRLLEVRQAFQKFALQYTKADFYRETVAGRKHIYFYKRGDDKMVCGYWGLYSKKLNLIAVSQLTLH
jgi:hypothetical protein